MKNLKHHKSKIKFLLNQNKEKLLETRTGKIGGVYVASIDMGDDISLEVEDTPEENIVLSFSCDPSDAVELKEFMTSELRELGVYVYDNYKDFEDKYFVEEY